VMIDRNGVEHANIPSLLHQSVKWVPIGGNRYRNPVTGEIICAMVEPGWPTDNLHPNGKPVKAHAEKGKHKQSELKS